MAFELLAAVAGTVSGGIAAVTGFGIGSLLTPVFALRLGTRLAVAAVAVPHVAGTALRFWFVRRHVDRRVLLGFGITSALGGLAGALLHARASSRALAVAFGVLLILAAMSELTGWMSRVRWGRTAAWIAGAISGLLGGLVGNQGGIRSASMLGFDVPKDSFVATTTAVGLFVDFARVPVYIATDGSALARQWPLLLAATIGVVTGTLLGIQLLRRLPERVFRRLVAVLLLLLGVYMIVAGGG
jgi:uncharacterized membrane protein YfcA